MATCVPHARQPGARSFLCAIKIQLFTLCGPLFGCVDCAPNNAPRARIVIALFVTGVRRTMCMSWKASTLIRLCAVFVTAPDCRHTCVSDCWRASVLAHRCSFMRVRVRASAYIILEHQSSYTDVDGECAWRRRLFASVQQIKCRAICLNVRNEIHATTHARGFATAAAAAVRYTVLILRPSGRSRAFQWNYEMCTT